MLIAIFVVGYLAIVFEHQLHLNKAAPALLTGVLCWTVFVAFGDSAHVNSQLLHHLAEVSQILFFLLGAMTIVELIDAHDGFELITSSVKTTNRRKLLITLAAMTFVLSPVLDNLTTSIVMMSLVRKLASETEDRMYLGGVVIIAANAGGAWSPIGDVTTTMLWVGNQITTTSTILHLFVPSVVSVIVPLVWIGYGMKGEVRRARRNGGGEGERIQSQIEIGLPGLSKLSAITLPEDAAAVGKTLASLDMRARTGGSVVAVTRGGQAMSPSPHDPLQAGDELAIAGAPEVVALATELLLTGVAPKPTTALEQKIVLVAGAGALIFVPVFKTVTHLPPMMGMLLGLGALWTLTEFIHKQKNDEGRKPLSVAGALQRIDSESVLFFLGILLAIGALQSAGLLGELAGWMERTIGNVDLITMAIGLASAVVDNVPLVAAAQGMYSLTTYPTDHHFWLFLAYCAGTGGSILIIGSAAGVAVMGIQRISFGWYVRRFSLPALLGYAAGAATYLAMSGWG